ncbi:MAG: NepR family anti-sigma factor [Methylocystis sp.]|uniref:NepR family anti-sigma factor n=1 Tax=Methylocystis sp. TaxID=1911079 RepID=UPI0039281276
MDSKIEQSAAGDRRRMLRDKRKEAACPLSLLGFNVKMTVELRDLYGDCLSAPVPDRIRDLLARLAGPLE